MPLKHLEDSFFLDFLSARSKLGVPKESQDFGGFAQPQGRVSPVDQEIIMKKKFLSNAPPVLSNAPPGLRTTMNATLTTSAHKARALNGTIRDTVHATG